MKIMTIKKLTFGSFMFTHPTTPTIQGYDLAMSNTHSEKQIKGILHIMLRSPVVSEEDPDCC